MPLIILLLGITMAYADTIQVEGHRNYHVEYSSSALKLVSSSLSLNFQKKDCNKIIFDQFISKMKKMRTLAHEPGHGPNKLNYRLNGLKYSDQRGTPKAKLLDSLPEELERMKIEESLRCK